MSIDELFQAAVENYQAGKLAQAEILGSQIVARYPRHADALHLLGIVGHALGRTDAVAWIRRSVALQPDHAPSQHNLGFLLESQGAYAEATRCYERAVALQPDYADAHYHLGLIRLLQGDFPRGLAEHEWRSKASSFKATHRSLGRPRWDGDKLAGRVLLLHAEQGIGDTIQFLRYVPMLVERERRPKLVVLCHSALRSLAERNLSRFGAITSSVHPGDFDVEYALDSLPYFFRTTLGSIPGGVPYLVPGTEKVEHWRKRLATNPRSLKVGLVWAGNKAHPKDHLRSMAFSDLTPFGGVSGVSYHSLQKGEASAPLGASPGLRLTDHTGELQDFDDTAALVANLDLVITVDTSVAHLAGALGKPVWVMLSFVPDWRWMLEREDSPWYPTMRLFRQREPGNWAEVVGRVAGALSLLVK